ncbi:MAG: hypothetical protein KGH59_03850 [Candidatus Micrarchaeota archaeon]|nr:hypothetical protein [Candidatus Micrarchaeota archaeon]MDE1804886.1 hypothetical protein [Candidatus Micrarchaeota archaeon]MDE1846647.1 hypothetical protein [Candidatus Micrarchaeota archaeon]
MEIAKIAIVFPAIKAAAPFGAAYLLSIVSTLGYVQQILTQVGPMLSAVLFIVAGIFYAVGQVLPPDKKANFHTTSVNVIIGAIIVAVLSVASSGLAVASTHLLVNVTANSIG